MSREKVIDLYRKYLIQHPELVRKAAEEFKGKKRIGCWCYPEPCHGEILLEEVKKYWDN